MCIPGNAAQRRIRVVEQVLGELLLLKFVVSPPPGEMPAAIPQPRQVLPSSSILETRHDYYARVKANPIALTVKAADLTDTLTPHDCSC